MEVSAEQQEKAHSPMKSMEEDGSNSTEESLVQA
jgi:hypothetical protein